MHFCWGKSLCKWYKLTALTITPHAIKNVGMLSVALSAQKKRRTEGPAHAFKHEHTGHFVQPQVAAHCGGDIYSRRKPLFSSFGEHTAVCGSSERQAVARPRHRQSVCIHNIHVAATCRPSVLGSATMRGHMWLNKVATLPMHLNMSSHASKRITHRKKYHQHTSSAFF